MVTGAAGHSNHRAIPKARQAAPAWLWSQPCSTAPPFSVDSCALSQLPTHRKHTGPCLLQQKVSPEQKVSAPESSRESRLLAQGNLKVVQSSPWVGCWASPKEQVQGGVGVCSGRRSSSTPEKLRQRDPFLPGFSHGLDTNGRSVLHKIYYVPTKCQEPRSGCH